MVNARSENNTIRVSVKNTSTVTKANASSINNSSPVNASNNKAQMYEQIALGHANTAKQYAEQAEQSANNAQSYVESVIETKDELLNNEDFKTVVTNIDNINTVGENIENVITIAEDLEGVADNLDVINNVNDNLDVITSVNSNLENINTVASNIEDIQNAKENANIAKEKAQESFDYSELSKHYSEVSKAQADITIANTEIAITKANEASQSASNSLKSSQNSALSEANAKESENKAKVSETNAKISEQNAKSSEQKCQEIYDRLGVAIIVKGRVDSLEDLPTTNVVNGDAYLVGVAGLDSYPEYYWYEDHWEYMGSTEVKLEWGGISGTLSNQSDLQAVLDNKANTSDIPDVSNLATKDEIPTYTAGENITIENNVISSTGGSVDLTGYIKNKEVMTESIVIGNTSTASNAIAIGTNLRATGRYSIAMGDDCTLSNTLGISIGKANYLNGASNITIGSNLTTRDGNSIAIGVGSYPNASASGGNSIAIGTIAQATGSQSIALGRAAKATQSYAIQLGIGTNNTADSLQVWDYPLLNKADGKIPADRLPDVSIPDEYITETELEEALKNVGGGLPIGQILKVTANPNYVPEGTLYIGSVQDRAKAEFQQLWNNWLTGTARFVSSCMIYYLNNSNFEAVLGIKTPDDVVTNKQLIVDYSSSSIIAYIRDGYLCIGSSGIQQTAIQPNSMVYIKLKVENGSLMVSSGTSQNNLSEPFNFGTVNLGSHFDCYVPLIETSTINGELLHNNGVFNSSLDTGNHEITEDGVSLEGASLPVCTYAEYKTELTMTGSCYKWAVDLEAQTFRTPFVPDKVLTDVADTVDVKGNGNALGYQGVDGTLDLYAGVHNISSNSTRHFSIASASKTDSAPKIGDSLSWNGTSTGHTGDTAIGINTDASKSGIIADTTSAKTYTTIRHFVVVANGSINQSQMDWSAWASGLQGKANIDGSNFNESVKNFDGQWVVVTDYPVLTSATAVGDYTLDISDYLPQDNFAYEIMLRVQAHNSSGTGKFFYVGTDLIPITSSPASPIRLSIDSDTVRLMTNTAVLCTLNRTIVAKIAGGALNSSVISLIAYRRIGTNQ